MPVAALLSGVFAAGAAAQETGRELAKLSPRAVLAGEEALRPGNSLWAVPLSELSQTRARPLFSPSRRPFAPSVMAALPTPPTAPAPPRKREADHPLLTLLGTIVGGSVEIGVFVDQASHDVVRLKVGEAHDGWTLHAVAGRTAVFHKDGAGAATLALPTPGGQQDTAVAPTDAPEPHIVPATTKGGLNRPPRAS